jgi:hypothetical protein
VLDKQQKSGLEVELCAERKINSDEFIVLKFQFNCNKYPKRLGIPQYRKILYLQPKRVLKFRPARHSNFNFLALCAAAMLLRALFINIAPPLAIFLIRD